MNCNIIKLMLQIPKPPFWIYICLFLMALFQQTFIYDKRDHFDVDIVNISFLDSDVPPVVPLIGFTFHNLLGLLEFAVM